MRLALCFQRRQRGGGTLIDDSWFTDAEGDLHFAKKALRTWETTACSEKSTLEFSQKCGGFVQRTTAGKRVGSTSRQQRKVR